MNKKGQAIVITFLVGIFLLITSIILIDPMKDIIQNARTPTQLDCGNESISTGTAATCLVVDLTLPYFIAMAIVLGFGGAVAIQIRKRQ